MDGSGRRQTLKMCWCSRRRGRGGNVLNTKNAPLWARLWCSTRGEGQRMCRTPKTRLCGHVCGVRHEGKGRVRHQKHPHRVVFGVRHEGEGERSPKHPEYALVGRILVFETRERGGNVPDTENMPHRACLQCSAHGGDKGGCRTPKTRPCGHILGVQ